MLRFTFSPDGSLPKHAPAKYPDVLESNGSFTITVDGRVFFTEPSFPIYEFLSQANEWMNGGRVPDSMEYASLETDENPLICFRRISILRGIGIVESRHGSGNYVTKDPGSSISMMIKAMLALKSTSKAEIIQVRKVISYSVCELIMDRGLTKEEVADFQSILDGMITASKEEFAEYDRIFHRKLMLLTDNTLFRTLMEPIGEAYLELIPEVIGHTDADSRKALVDIHALLISGLVDHDREKCKAYFEKHYGFVEDGLEL